MRLVLTDEKYPPPGEEYVSGEVMQKILFILNLLDKNPPHPREGVCMCVIHTQEMDIEWLLFSICPICRKRREYKHIVFDPAWKQPKELTG